MKSVLFLILVSCLLSTSCVGLRLKNYSNFHLPTHDLVDRWIAAGKPAPE